MTLTTAATASAPASASASPQKFGFAALGQDDFLRLMVEQLKMQDPFAPTDNKEMLAQMAQFSSLSASTEMGDTLKTIAAKLDAILAAQQAAASSPAAAIPADPTTGS
jgi:flagellar basal-body rod modification protein FlgD